MSLHGLSLCTHFNLSTFSVKVVIRRLSGGDEGSGNEVEADKSVATVGP